MKKGICGKLTSVSEVQSKVQVDVGVGVVVGVGVGVVVGGEVEDKYDAEKVEWIDMETR